MPYTPVTTTRRMAQAELLPDVLQHFGATEYNRPLQIFLEHNSPLRYLAEGDDYQTAKWTYSISRYWVGQFLQEYNQGDKRPVSRGQ